MKERKATRIAGLKTSRHAMCYFKQFSKACNGKRESIVVVVCLRVVKNNKLLHFGRCQSKIVKVLERRIPGPQMATGAECFLYTHSDTIKLVMVTGHQNRDLPFLGEKLKPANKGNIELLAAVRNSQTTVFLKITLTVMSSLVWRLIFVTRRSAT